MPQIHDKFEKVPDRRVRYRFRKLAQGCCGICGKPQDDQFKTCSTCRKARNAKYRKPYVPKPKEERKAPETTSKYTGYVL